uniref:START domain-containing protein n=1 Tax=Chromera velia CCMP2878 TaxID=1169474 RepID=A0A0G4FST9_9ALVE|eukprot:Cvel_18508.t1-p1 / transcript=Cvel_18508.t1 / gene=Cvel_18508 / organism=Chromera_velia_CCMP2878 / gene_product=Collagen type IV alpha-3-binding protein, putative / transcript_product=Collagen type IV alpha-3-binding protein, putative / location=Cvel_scaffold1537:23216-26430(+) / protein_length=542 / sequence_SO=supercontig / SO=protein_coding / is_pseudo=false
MRSAEGQRKAEGLNSTQPEAPSSSSSENVPAPIEPQEAPPVVEPESSSFFQIPRVLRLCYGDRKPRKPETSAFEGLAPSTAAGDSPQHAFSGDSRDGASASPSGGATSSSAGGGISQAIASRFSCLGMRKGKLTQREKEILYRQSLPQERGEKTGNSPVSGSSPSKGVRGGLHPHAVPIEGGGLGVVDDTERDDGGEFGKTVFHENGLGEEAGGLDRFGSSESNTGFVTPPDDYIGFSLGHLEERRNEVIRIQRKALTGTPADVEIPKGWERKRQLRELGELLISTAKECRNEEPSKTGCALCYDQNGVKVWKKEFGIGRLVIRAEWTVPVTPMAYCDYASDIKFRKSWDHNCEEICLVESLGEQCDLIYVATKRIATIYPRDSLNLKIKRCFQPATADVGEWTSCSCSVEHPDYPERKGRVRADLRIASYAAKPLLTPMGVWSRIVLFTEGDPKGWIPGAVTKMLAAKVTPSSVEKATLGVLTKHGIKPADGEKATNFAARHLALWKEQGQEVREMTVEDMKTYGPDGKKRGELGEEGLRG